MKQIWKNGWRRVLALVLCLATILPMVPLYVFAASGDLLIEGVVDNGGTNSGSVSVGNGLPYYTHVENATTNETNNMLKAGQSYLIMNEKTGDILSYNPVATVEGVANLPTSLSLGTGYAVKSNYTGTAEGKYSVNGRPKEIYIDNSQRNNAEWIFGPLQGSVTEGTTMAFMKDNASGYGDSYDSVSTNMIIDRVYRQWSSNARDQKTLEDGYPAYWGHRLRVWSNVTASTFTNGYGFEFYKGRKGTNTNASYTGGASHATLAQGTYWDIPVVNGTNLDGTTNTTAVDNQRYFPYLNFRSTDNPFANEQLWAEQKKINANDTSSQARANFKLAFFDTGANMKFSIYYRQGENPSNNADYRILIQDENKNWGVRQYAYNSADPYVYPLSDIGGDFDNILLRLYRYTGTVSKTVKLAGSKNFTVATGTPAETVVEGLMKSVKVTDSTSGLAVAGSGNVKMAGRYFFSSHSSNGTVVSDSTFSSTGTKTIYIYYCNDDGTVKQLGNISVTVANPTLPTATTLYVSQNSRIGDAVYTYNSSNKTYTAVNFTLGGKSIPVTVQHLIKNGQIISTNESGSQSSVSLTYAGVSRGTVTVQVVEKTINNQIPTGTQPGAVSASKTGSPASGSAIPSTGEVEVTLSASGVPYNQRGIDMIVVMDLSPSMRKYVTNASQEGPVYYDYRHGFNEIGIENTKWTETLHKNTRLYAMEQSLNSMITALQNSGKNVRIAIADCGDLDHFAFPGAAIMTDSSHNSGKWPYMENSGSHTTGWDRASEFANHLNYVFSSGDSNAGPYGIHNWKYWSQSALQSYYTDGTDAISEAMIGVFDSKIYTGLSGYDINSFVDVKTITANTMKELYHDIRVRNSYMLGSNYDMGMETAYHLAKACQEDNIHNGADRDIVCVFLSDGGITQYNYFSGQESSQAWQDYLTGGQASLGKNYSFPTTSDGIIDVSTAGLNAMHPDIKIVVNKFKTTNMRWNELFTKIRSSSTSVTISSGTFSGATLLQKLAIALRTPKSTTAGALETYSPYAYFYNPEGKNWWAEAMKGTVGELYPVINKYATGGANGGLSDYNGDTHNNFGSAAANGNHTSGLALHGQNYISGFDGLGVKLYTMGFSVNSVEQQVLMNMATDPTYFRAASNQQELTDGLTFVLDNLTKGASRSWMTDSIGDGFDLLQGSIISVTGGGTTAKYFKVVSNTDGAYDIKACNSSGTVSGSNLRQSNNVVNMGDLLLFNANSAHTSKDLNGDGKTNLDDGDVVNGQIKLDLDGDGKLDNFVINPETFFWRIGPVPQTAISLKYKVDLTGYNGSHINNSGTVYTNKGDAVLHYQDLRYNDLEIPLTSPYYTLTAKSTYTKFAFYDTDSKKILYVSGQVTLPGNTTVTVNAATEWNKLTDSWKSQYGTPSATATIKSDAHRQNHNITFTGSNVKWRANASKNATLPTTDADATDVLNSVLEANTIYFPVTAKSESDSIKYVHYQANTSGEPVDNSNVKSSTITTLGSEKTLNVSVKANATPANSSEIVSSAVVSDMNIGSNHTVYNSGNGKFKVTSNYGGNHVVTLTGLGVHLVNSSGTIVASGKSSGTVTYEVANGKLNTYKVYFPATIKKIDTAITYRYYLVTSDGTPVMNGSDYTVVCNQTGSASTALYATVSGSSKWFDKSSAIANGVNSNLYKVSSGGVTITSAYGSGDIHTLTVSGYARVVNGSTEITASSTDKVLTNAQLNGATVYIPVTYLTKSEKINYNMYTIKEADGTPITSDGSGCADKKVNLVGTSKQATISSTTATDNKNTNGTWAPTAFTNCAADQTKYTNVITDTSGTRPYRVKSTLRGTTATYKVELLKQWMRLIDKNGNIVAENTAGTTVTYTLPSGSSISDYTVCYPVTIKQISGNVKYQYYVVNSQGKAVHKNDKFATTDSVSNYLLVGNQINGGSYTFYATVNGSYPTNAWLTKNSTLSDLSSANQALYNTYTGAVNITSKYAADGAEAHKVAVSGGVRVVYGSENKTGTTVNLTDAQLQSAVIYIPVTFKTGSVTVYHQNYTVNGQGQMVNANNSTSGVTVPQLVGTRKDQPIATTTAGAVNTTAVTGSTAFSLVSSSVYSVYNEGNGSYTVSATYNGGHVITLSGAGMKLVKKSGTSNVLVNPDTTGGSVYTIAATENLSNYTVCFPVTIKTESHKIDYKFYLVDGSGNPVISNSNWQTWDINVAAESVTLLATATSASSWGAFTANTTAMSNSGIDTNRIELVGSGLTAGLLSQYGTNSHKLTLPTGKNIRLYNGSTTAVVNSAETTLTDAQLSKAIVYFPVKYKTATTTIKYGNYLVNSNGEPCGTDGQKLASGNYTLLNADGQLGTHTVNMDGSFTDKANGSVTGAMAFEKISSAVYKQRGSATASFTSHFLNGHKVTLTNGALLFKGNAKQNVTGYITNDTLDDYTIYFPVEINQFTTTVNYVFYVVNENGKPINATGTEVAIGSAQQLKTGTFGPQTFLATVHTAGNKWISINDATRNMNDLYKAYGDNSVTVTSKYAADSNAHTVVISGNAKVVNGGNTYTAGTNKLTNAQLNGATIYLPVVKRTAETHTIKYGFYLKGTQTPVGDLLSTTITVQPSESAVDYTVTAGKAPLGYKMAGGNTAKVNAHFLNNQYKVITVDPIKYQKGTSSTWNAGTSAIYDATGLADVTIWFPVEKIEVVIKSKFYLVDSNGTALNAQGGAANGLSNALTLKDSSEIAVTSDNKATMTTQVKSTKNFSNDLMNRFSVYNDQAVYTVLTTWEDGKSALTVTDSASKVTTKIVKTTDHSNVASGTKVNNTDMSSYTVYFALKLNDLVKDDALVVDFGMPTAATVMENDTGLVNGNIIGIMKTNTLLDGYKPSTYTSQAGTKVADAHGQFWYLDKGAKNVDQVAYSTSSSDWTAAETFYYCVEDYDTGKEGQKYYYYGTVTVIPATTLYFEDDANLITYSAKMYKKDANGKYNTDSNGKKIEYPNDVTKYDWIKEPGQSDVLINAGDIYGFSDAYKNCTTYSMGGVHHVKVDTDHFATATFSFRGTGFDLISMTNGTTGNIVVRVYNSGDQRVVNKTVDTYYGYKYENGQWIADGSDSDSLYQVPVIKAVDLPYDTYRVEIAVSYAAFFDHNKNDEGFDFYLDAIRIYDPLNDGNGNAEIEKIYTDDHEGWPEYYELRNQIISTGDLDYSNDKMSIAGAVFIDRKGTTDGKDQDAALSIADYKNYGPKNELYLAKGQSIAFKLDVQNTTLDRVQIGLKSANGAAVSASLFKLNSVSSSTAATNRKNFTIQTATEMYYDITDLNKGIVVITNASNTDSILSVTNIKATYTAAHTDGLAQAFGKLNVFEMVDELGEVLGGASTPDTDTGVSGSGKVKMTGASLSLKGEIFVNYYLVATGAKESTVDGVTKAENVGLLMWSKQPDTTKTAQELYDSAETIVVGALKNGTQYVIQTPGIAAKKMGDTIYACAYVENNGTYTFSQVSTYSPKTYCENKLGAAAKETDISKLSAFQKVLVGMLNYGTAAQEYFNYNVDIWLPRINASLSKELKQVAYSTLADAPTAGVAAAVSGKTQDANAQFGTTVSFDGSLALNFYIKPSKTPSGDVTFYYWTDDDYNATNAQKLSGYTGMSYITKGADVTEFRAQVSDIVARNINDTVYITAVYTSGGVEYATPIYQYSVRNYCESHDAATDPMSALAQATAVYGAYAKAYMEQQ